MTSYAPTPPAASTTADSSNSASQFHPGPAAGDGIPGAGGAAPTELVGVADIGAADAAGVGVEAGAGVAVDDDPGPGSGVPVVVVPADGGAVAGGPRRPAAHSTARARIDPERPAPEAALDRPAAASPAAPFSPRISSRSADSSTASGRSTESFSTSVPSSLPADSASTVASSVNSEAACTLTAVDSWSTNAAYVYAPPRPVQSAVVTTTSTTYVTRSVSFTLPPSPESVSLSDNRCGPPPAYSPSASSSSSRSSPPSPPLAAL